MSTSTRSPSQRRIRCKMCRIELATRDHVVHARSELHESPTDELEPEVTPADPQATDPNAPSHLNEQMAQDAPIPTLLRLPSSPAVLTAVPILSNPKCSGYFVEPMPWMSSFTEGGETAGKILCPNSKCKAKLGNYDWAGVGCGCKEWVTPGFCINRSKVDEIAW